MSITDELRRLHEYYNPYNNPYSTVVIIVISRIL